MWQAESGREQICWGATTSRQSVRALRRHARAGYQPERALTVAELRLLGAAR
jgi:hypothetical protein